MKRSTIFLLTIITFSAVYVALDRQSFYYGRSRLSCYRILPLGIKTESRPDFEGGFTLRDKYGFSIAGKGNTYSFNETYFSISKILSYCFNSDKLIALVEDARGESFTILFSNKSENDLGKEINAEVIGGPSEIDLNKYKCIELENRKHKDTINAIFKSIAVFAQLTLLFLVFLGIFSIKRR